MLHVIKTSQFLNQKIDVIWDFMSSPNNLSLITPEYMGFEMINGSKEEKMFPGQIIEYYVSPVMNIKLHWVTEITQVKEKQFFIDEQRFGPYQFWHHKHFMKEKNGGVEMIDIIHYKLPLGILGKLGNYLFVEKQLKSIFDYRYQKLEKLFNHGALI